MGAPEPFNSGRRLTPAEKNWASASVGLLGVGEDGSTAAPAAPTSLAVLLALLYALVRLTVVSEVAELCVGERAAPGGEHGVRDHDRQPGEPGG